MKTDAEPDPKWLQDTGAHKFGKSVAPVVTPVVPTAEKDAAEWKAAAELIRFDIC